MLDILNTIDWSKFTVNVLIGYAISWIYFLGTLGFIQHFVGKTAGYFINYGLSCIVWFIVFNALHVLNPKGEL
jgi:hypothetical protein